MTVATCTECGCTDARACVTDAGPCWWVHNDALAGLFLCSACAYAEPTISVDVDTADVDGPGDREAGKTAPAGHIAVPNPLILARGFTPSGVASLAHGPTDSPAAADPGAKNPRDVHRAGPASNQVVGDRRGGRVRECAGRHGP